MDEVVPVGDRPGPKFLYSKIIRYRRREQHLMLVFHTCVTQQLKAWLHCEWEPEPKLGWSVSEMKQSLMLEVRRRRPESWSSKLESWVFTTKILGG
ncbi:uncharacterized protein PHALS_14858 [Plasmopara halstedii]|uniref:Uncharacterized protein n=1 Tax=Plasmopara halstedii TaxID=4781 RepID=A0A0P1AV25_PLAHL|nr:uncharacterized protein PHALS_14858 [Plasmopara halstedii]CEG46033.1 hypothetical protein PHALS_14858 [Plasmopara halstedii]|eukprot:XP_024582402.1 hypothetical protein PHALS_14858 [Plasmopara halstedii]